ncbi:MAG: hypothetical protein U1F43_14705 [Myxococcota bacterium]
MKLRNIGGMAAMGLFIGCSGSGGPSADGTGVNIKVAALTLPGISYACYDVLVQNADSDTVWSAGTVGESQADGDDTTLCSNQYGNLDGGAITYIGTCDADGADTDGDGLSEQTNTVTLWVDGLYGEDGNDLGQWRDPCPNGCALEVKCEENTDALVEFNLTVMRDANQGFFDIAVNFQDIFCSAKLDTCYPGDPEKEIDLLFGDDSTRDWTAVYAFACTAGSDATDTTLELGRIVVDCGEGNTFPIDPTGLAGNNESENEVGDVLHYGIYRGIEDLDCGAGPGSCHKRYWNLAFDLADLPDGCSLAFKATATDGNAGFTAGKPNADGVSWPYISVDVDLTGDGGAFCQQNPLNGQGSGVSTVYAGSLLGLPTPETMCYEFDGEDAIDTGNCDAAAVTDPNGSQGIATVIATKIEKRVSGQNPALTTDTLIGENGGGYDDLEDWYVFDYTNTSATFFIKCGTLGTAANVRYQLINNVGDIIVDHIADGTNRDVFYGTTLNPGASNALFLRVIWEGGATTTAGQQYLCGIATSSPISLNPVP